MLQHLILQVGAPPSPRRRPPLARVLRDLEAQLQSHSDLEDLGPLFAPEAQGRESSRSSP